MLELLIVFGPLLLVPFFFALDLLHRARDYYRPRWWRTRATAVTTLAIAVSVGTGMLWESVLDFPSVFDLSGWGVLGGATAGALVYLVAAYWMHRASHSFKPWWLVGHQMHHAPESLDAFGALYVSPFDMALYTSVNVLVFYPLLGISPGAGALAAAVLMFLSIFPHANIRTPRWLGYLVQRPESHSLHHARGLHRFNYSDLPLLDMLFGTFRNPKEFVPRVGFYDGASARIGDMLLARDVSKPPTDLHESPVAQVA
ncbi:MAG: sterol desaturase family protein [Planctomycetes bacterium]|nr:sterol desaturase family protein [Planctomycetota bacterium]MCW8135394.1 sterol desaturase family protein [Planctomycetota bacterium]